MDLSRRLAISYYKTIATINEPHKIYLVQHLKSQKIYVKKILDVYNIYIYEYLHNHPINGTPKIIDYCEEGDQLTIIEEYISGCSLQEKIQNHSLSLNDILSYMQDICDVVDQLHSITPAVIHRDIKPSNVVITNYNRAVLLDFNAAKYYSSSSTEDTILLGTQGYAAPEQYGFGSSTPQTDIYSLGIMLKEMLISANLNFAEYATVIQKSTQINPAERYQGIKDFKKALSAKTDSKLLITPSSNPESFTPPGFRSKKIWKMFVASIYYIFISWLCLTLQVKNVSGVALWFEKIFLLAMFLFVPIGCFNYRNVQKFMPLCKYKNRFVRYLGIALLNVVVIFGLFLILFVVETVFFNL